MAARDILKPGNQPQASLTVPERTAVLRRSLGPRWKGNLPGHSTARWLHDTLESILGF